MRKTMPSSSTCSRTAVENRWRRKMELKLALCNIREGEINHNGSMLGLVLKNGGFHDGTVGYACMRSFSFSDLQR